VETGSGSISVDSAKAKLAARTGGGDVRLGELEGETRAETGSGSISVKKAKGKLMARSGGGDIKLGEISGTAQVETGSGSIRATSVRAGLMARSGGGDMQIDDASDTVIVHTGSGSISASFSAQPKEECRLTTSGGDIIVKVDDKLAFDIEAKTSGGRVTTEAPITATVVGEHTSDELKGKLNGGGKVLLLKTGSGNINIRKL